MMGTPLSCVTRVLSGIIAVAALTAATLPMEGPAADAIAQPTPYVGATGAEPDNGSLYRNAFTGVSVLSPEDVWAIGNRGTGDGDYRPFVQRYDGVSWTTIGDIDIPGDEYPTSIFALSDDDVWATFESTAGDAQTIVQHWDGKTWHLQDITVPSRYVRLFQVWAASPTDVYVVGQAYRSKSETNHALILHFDGTRWERMPVPPEAVGGLTSVRGSSPTDVWAVGYLDGNQGPEAMFLHWDGVRWRIQGRFGQPGDTFLEGIDVVSPTDAWAVGDTTPEDMNTRGLIMHWNGRRWSDTYSDAMRKVPRLYGVAAIAPDDAWAVGSDFDGRARSAHWDGHAWHLVPVRNPGSVDNQLFAVSADAADDVWAVGRFVDGSPHRMTQHWNGTAWTR